MRGSDAGSGTIGALAALGVSVLLRPVGWEAQLAATVLVTLTSIVVTAPYADEGDPGWIVIDEAAGALLATIGLATPAMFLAFLVFRGADIWKKTPGVGQAERLPGGWGITLDDVVAGGYGLAAGWLLQTLVF